MGDNGLWKGAVLASQLGFSVACPMAVFIAGGVWADGKLGTKPWLFFVGLIVGVIAAGAALYQVVAAQPKKRTDPVAKEAPDKIERGTTGGSTTQVKTTAERDILKDLEDKDDYLFEDYDR